MKTIPDRTTIIINTLHHTPRKSNLATGAHPLSAHELPKHSESATIAIPSSRRGRGSAVVVVVVVVVALAVAGQTITSAVPARLCVKCFGCVYVHRHQGL